MLKISLGIVYLHITLPYGSPFSSGQCIKFFLGLTEMYLRGVTVFRTQDKITKIIIR